MEEDVEFLWLSNPGIARRIKLGSTTQCQASVVGISIYITMYLEIPNILSYLYYASTMF